MAWNFVLYSTSLYPRLPLVPWAANIEFTMLECPDGGARGVVPLSQNPATPRNNQSEPRSTYRVWCSGNIDDSHFHRSEKASSAPGSTPGIRVSTLLLPSARGHVLLSFCPETHDALSRAVAASCKSPASGATVARMAALSPWQQPQVQVVGSRLSTRSCTETGSQGYLPTRRGSTARLTRPPASNQPADGRHRLRNG